MPLEQNPGERRLVSQILRERVGGCRGLEHVVEASSTNTLALDELRSGRLTAADLPRIHVADRQTGGRGRSGRSWVSDEGTLTFSLTLLSTVPLELLPLAIGVGVARSLEFELAPLRIALKWPNDLRLNEGKLGGILCERAATGTRSGAVDAVVVGLGINVDSSPAVEGSRSACLAEAVGRPIGRYAILGSLIEGIDQTVAALVEDPTFVLAEFRRRCCLTDRQVRFIHAGQPAMGVCQGIDDDGSLRVRVGDRSISVRSGDVQTVRPTGSGTP